MRKEIEHAPDGENLCTALAVTLLVALLTACGGEYEVRLKAEPEAGGDLAGKGEYPAGEQITVLAAPGDSYEFVHWQDDDGRTITGDKKHRIEVQDDVTLTAHFAREEQKDSEGEPGELQEEIEKQNHLLHSALTRILPDLEEKDRDELENPGALFQYLMRRYSLYKEILENLPEEIIVELAEKWWEYELVTVEQRESEVVRSDFPADGVIEVSDPGFCVMMNDRPASEVGGLPPPPSDSVPPPLSFRRDIDDLILEEARMDLSEHIEVQKMPADDYYIGRLGSCSIADASWFLRFAESLSPGDEVHLKISEDYRRELDLSTNHLTVIVKDGD